MFAPSACVGHNLETYLSLPVFFLFNIAHRARPRLVPPRHSFWWHWYNTTSLPPKQQGLNTPWSPNLPAYAKHWRSWNTSWQNLPATPLWTRDTALQSWIRNPANYSSIANSNKTHATMKCGTNHTQMNLGNSAKALVQVTKPAAMSCRNQHIPPYLVLRHPSPQA